MKITEFCKKNGIIAVPFIVLMISPWIHKIIFNNLLLAWPDVDKGGAHIFIGMLTLIGIFISSMIRFS